MHKFCVEEKKSGMNLSLNRVWDKTAALIGVSRSTAQQIVEEKKKAKEEQQQPKQPPFLRQKCHYKKMTLTRVLNGRPSPACTP